MKKHSGLVLFILMASFLFSHQIYAAGVDKEYPSHSSREESFWANIIDMVIGSGVNKPQSYALVIGISNYSNGFEPLRTTNNDAKRVADFLYDEAKFQNVHLLTEEQATKEKITYLMKQYYPSVVKSNDRFIFYWSGHGDQFVENNITEGVLPLIHSRKGDFESMIRMNELDDWDGKIEAHQSLFLLDSCFSGLAGIEEKGTNASLNLKQFYRPSHHLITAGTKSDIAIASSEWGGSLFTKTILDGWRGGADTSKGRNSEYPRDGIVSLSELISFVKESVAYEANLKGWNKSLTPQMTNLQANEGEFFILTSDFKFNKKSILDIFNQDTTYGRGESKGFENEQFNYLKSQVDLMNHDQRKTRRTATHRVKNMYSDNETVVNLVLDKLSKNSFSSVSNQAKVNYLFYLKNTSPGNWNIELQNKAKRVVVYLKAKVLAKQASGEFAIFSIMMKKI